MSQKPISGLETALEACEFFDNPKGNANLGIINEQGIKFAVDTNNTTIQGH